MQAPQDFVPTSPQDLSPSTELCVPLPRLQRRVVYLSTSLAAHLEVRRQVEQQLAETESAAEAARQATALRFAEALRYINDVVIELRVESAAPEHIRQSIVTHCSASFSGTFGRENDGTRGLLFELVDPGDETELERLLCDAACGALGGAVAATGSLAFLSPNGKRRRLQLQVVRLLPLSSQMTPAPSPYGSMDDLVKLVDECIGPGSSSHAGRRSTSAPLPLEPLSLFVVCKDLSDALRQAEREIEQKAHRVLNHTAKRVMANTSQCCQMVIEQLGSLKASTAEETQSTLDGVLGLLRTTLSESVTGYHFCRTAILQAAIESGVRRRRSNSKPRAPRALLSPSRARSPVEQEHTPTLETFSLASLLEDLGFAHHKRVGLRDAVGVPLRADLQLLTCILFNAVHNALVHGEKGSTVAVVAHLGDEARCAGVGCGEDPSNRGGGAGVGAGADSCRECSGRRSTPGTADLHVTVCNRAGPHHESLRAMDVLDLFANGDMGAALRQQGVGAEGSTYLGLPEIVRAARMISPAAVVHLWVRPAEVCFELRMQVMLPETPRSPCEQQPTLPAVVVPEVLHEVAFPAPVPVPVPVLVPVPAPSAAATQEAPASSISPVASPVLPPGLIWVR